LAEGAYDKSLERFDRLRFAEGSLKTAEIRLDMQKTMQQHAAVFRSADVLAEGEQKIAQIRES
jgi:succinate dehydrogenase / fumarate reductase flavoprotein subunit